MVNSYWMASEFFHFDTVAVAQGVTGKHLALVPFLIELGILLYHYLVQKPSEARESQVITL